MVLELHFPGLILPNSIFCNAGVFKLAKASAVVSAAKKIVLIKKKEDPFNTQIDLKTLLTEEKYPDFIRYYFKDLETSEDYVLSVETYHGNGGSLEKIEK